MYSYVTRKETRRYDALCRSALTPLHQELRSKYDIRCKISLIGSGGRNLVTRNGHGGIDLDYDLKLSGTIRSGLIDTDSLKDTIRNCLDRYALDAGFSHGRDSTSALTYQYHEGAGEGTFHFDLGIICRNEKGQLCRLIHDKEQRRYIWLILPDSMHTASYAREIIDAGRWEQLRDEYLRLKNLYLTNNEEDTHPSYRVYTEAVNLVWDEIRRQNMSKGKVSGSTHTPSQMNHHANQGNPNNSAHKAAANNRANQMNPNHGKSKGK